MVTNMGTSETGKCGDSASSMSGEMQQTQTAMAAAQTCPLS